MPMPSTGFDLPNLRNPKANLRPGGPGRIKGLQNRITRDLKLGLIDAAVAHGDNGEGRNGLPGYLFHLARDHPRSFAQLLCKLLPMQINSDTVSSSIVASINVVSVPTNHFVTPEGSAAMSEPMTPEHAPQLDEPVPVEAENVVEFEREPEPVGAETGRQIIRAASLRRR